MTPYREGTGPEQPPPPPFNWRLWLAWGWLIGVVLGPPVVGGFVDGWDWSQPYWWRGWFMFLGGVAAFGVGFFGVIVPSMAAAHWVFDGDGDRSDWERKRGLR